jgi:hypothetical protein
VTEEDLADKKCGSESKNADENGVPHGATAVAIEAIDVAASSRVQRALPSSC